MEERLSCPTINICQIEFFVCKQVVLDEENYGGKLYITIYAPWENVGKWFASGIEK